MTTQHTRPLARIVAQEIPNTTSTHHGDPDIARKHPLILAHHNDLHAAAIHWGLVKNAITPIWSASLAEEAVGPMSLYSDGYRKWRMSGGVSSPQLSAVWFRRPRKPEVFAGTRADDLACLRREWSEFHDNVYAMCNVLTDTLWINPPAAAVMTENKLVQLHAARQCGLCYPETLVSNDPDEIRSFIRKHGRLIYKSFARYTWPEPGKTFAVWAHMIDSSMQLDDAAVALCPGIYQAYVDKKYDLRVTVIGNRFFTVRIGPAEGSAPPDWRPYALANRIRLDAVTLPDIYQRKLELLMRKLNIVFGCIDLVVDTDGEIHFLEVNQSGDFLFAEELGGTLPLLQAMCAMLATGRVDYPLDAVRPLSYRDYLASDAHQEWERRNKQ
jgi:hypothetical protein